MNATSGGGTLDVVRGVQQDPAGKHMLLLDSSDGAQIPLETIKKGSFRITDVSNGAYAASPFHVTLPTPDFSFQVEAGKGVNSSDARTYSIPATPAAAKTYVFKIDADYIELTPFNWEGSSTGQIMFGGSDTRAGLYFDKYSGHWKWDDWSISTRVQFDQITNVKGAFSAEILFATSEVRLSIGNQTQTLPYSNSTRPDLAFSSIRGTIKIENLRVRYLPNNSSVDVSDANTAEWVWAETVNNIVPRSVEISEANADMEFFNLSGEWYYRDNKNNTTGKI